MRAVINGAAASVRPQALARVPTRISRIHPRIQRAAFLLCATWTLLGALPAHAELRGVALYERGDYARARKALEEELRSTNLSTEERVKARLYLAAVLHVSGAEGAALLQLEEVAMMAPAIQVDPILFPPEFVALAEKARKNVDARRRSLENARLEQERKRLDAERKHLEAERKRLDTERQAQVQAAAQPQAAAQAQASAQAQHPPEVPSPQASSMRVHLRPEVFGFADPLGKGAGVGGGLTLGVGAMDLTARVLLGDSTGFGAEVGLRLGSGPVQPRLALRGTAVPGAQAYGGGAVAGLRLRPTERLTFLLDVGAEYLKVQDPSEYRSFVPSCSVGAGFDLF